MYRFDAVFGLICKRRASYHFKLMNFKSFIALSWFNFALTVRILRNVQKLTVKNTTELGNFP